MPINNSVVTPSFKPFAVGRGAPSRSLSSDLRDRESDLVDSLRLFASEAARLCQQDTPEEYDDWVNDLTEPDPRDAPTRRSIRLASLLLAYADYMPSADCEFIDLTPFDYHGWAAPDGRVVIDLVTTLPMTELFTEEDEYLVFAATRNGLLLYDNMFAGVRHIVLDGPYESTWYPADGNSQPLLVSDVNPTISEVGEVL